MSSKEKQSNLSDDKVSMHMSEKRKSAFVTGATSGIGLAICKMLLSEGYMVFGIGRTIRENSFDDSAFKNTLNSLGPDLINLYECNVNEHSKVKNLLSDIKNKYGISSFDTVIFCAGVGYYGLHETIHEDNICEMIRTNVEAPIILTSYFLPKMKQQGFGHLIYISSVTADEVNPHGCAYGATKAALKSFATSLFEETRKNNVRVTTILPDMTNTNLYRNADFTADEAVCLNPEDVAKSVFYALDAPDGVDISEIKIKPQLHRIKKKTDKEKTDKEEYK